jgi:hypothetical protein
VADARKLAGMEVGQPEGRLAGTFPTAGEQRPREGCGFLEGETSEGRIPGVLAARNKAAKPRGSGNRQEVAKT